MAIKQIAANTFVVPNATTAPYVVSTDTDPTSGAGIVAPVGSVALRTDTPGVYVRTSPLLATGWTLLPPAETVRQIYTATGAEGTDFIVPLDVAQATSTYEVFAQARGMATLVGIDLPADPGDRSPLGFRIITTGALSAGDKIAFLITP